MADLQNAIIVSEAQYESLMLGNQVNGSYYNPNAIYLIDKGIGGLSNNYRDTKLWTNPNPTAAMGPSGYNIAYNEKNKLQEFKFIVIFLSTYYTNGSDEESIIKFKFLNPYFKAVNPEYSLKKGVYPYFISESGTTYDRRIILTSVNMFHVCKCVTSYGGSTSETGNFLIPLEIWGTNNL